MGVLLAVAVLVRSELTRHRAEVRHQVGAEVATLASGLERAVATSTTLADALAAFVRSDPGFTAAEFDAFAGALVAQHPRVRALELAPDGVVRQVHPRRGNEAAVGVDLAGQRETVGRALDAPGYVLGGPVELVQGAEGVVARLSIRDVPEPADDPTPGWWGLAAVVMDLDVLLEEAGFPTAEDDRFELRGVDGLGAEGARFAGVDLSAHDPVSRTVQLPGGEWYVAAVPGGGWTVWSPAAVLLLLGGILLAVLAGVLTWQLAAVPRRVRAATAEAAAAAASLRAVMDAASEAILAVDAGGMVVGANPAARALLAEGDDLRGRRIGEIVPEGIAEVTGEAGAVEPASVIAQRADGTRFAAVLTASRTADGALVTVVLRDVTEREATEEALAASTAELARHAAELERLNVELTRVDRVKRDFVAMASHEMRTPVTAVQGFAVTLHRHWQEMDDAARQLSITAIHRQSQRLWNVVSDLLVASEIETGDIHASSVPCDVPGLVRQRCEAAGIGEDQVAIDVPEGLVLCLPEAHVARILDALLSNATKYGQLPVTVRVTTGTASVTIRVHDQGPGIPEEFRGELFDRFSQASTGSRRTARGTGLGLAVARGLARAHGGDVVHLATLPGACFELRLPLRDAVDGTATRHCAPRTAV